MSIWPAPVSLDGTFARLEPLSQDHHDDLVEASQDGNLHELWYTTIPNAAAMRGEIDRRIGLSNMQPFAVIDKKSGKAVGMTTYMNCEQSNRKLEIGSTWYRTTVQRSPMNTECKLMLLTHAFEVLDCNCVEFRTHVLNTQSRRAVERLGAKLDGVLRGHMIMRNGTSRDTAAYSILANEWPAVRANLEFKLSRIGV